MEQEPMPRSESAMMSRGGRRATGALTKFRLLMWKNFLQQSRHRISTLVEVILPVSAMALILIMRSEIEPTIADMKMYPSIPAYSLDYSLNVLKGMNISDLVVAYSPESPVLEAVLIKATTKLISLNKNIEMVLVINVHAYKNSESLGKIYTSEEVTKRIIAGVEFDDDLYGATQLSNNLKFSLRFPERPRQYSFYSQGSSSWHTDETFPHFQVSGPRKPSDHSGGSAPGYVVEMFIALQHVISMELIAKLTSLDLSDFKVSVNRYPHPPFVQDFAAEALQFLLPMLIMVSFSYSGVNLVRAITLQKQMQLKETMKIMGLPTWLHWTAWFFKQFAFFLIVVILIVFLVKVHWFHTDEGFNKYSVFTNTPWTVLLFFFLLYASCIIFYCFMLSGFFSKAATATSFSGAIWFLTYLPAMVLMMDIKITSAMQTVFCLSVNTAMAFGVHFMLAEESGAGLQWGQFWQVSDLDSNRFVFGTVMVMLVVDCVLYMLIALYLEQVWPGPYAAPKPWNFIFMKSFWLHRKVEAAELTIDPKDTQDITMEEVLGYPTIGVKIMNLVKVYGKTMAVNNFNLDMYEDQITVLLGHNGAGKSTTMAMLTGNTEITSGSVWLAGYDIALQTQAARANIGFCPQNNVLFNELTVREHFEFYGRLKGLTGHELLDDIDTLISKLGLSHKRDYLAAGLSGGQKRRLSIGSALSGRSRVVFMDEPTTGMDPASRRALWELLQMEKIGRTMIVTTHFMEEADVLGDRIAIMAGGRLRCVGSPYFLKSHYGVSYTLVVVKKEGFEAEACTRIIREHIPGTNIKEDRGTEVTYALPKDLLHLFEDMLSDLEANIDTIKYENYGMRAPTLEDVFMTVGSDLSPNYTVSKDTLTSTPTSISGVNIHTEANLNGKRAMEHIPWKQHVLAVWLKLWLVWSRSWRLLLMQVLVSLLMISVTLGILNWAMAYTTISVRRALTLATGFVETETLLLYNGTSLGSHGADAKTAYDQMFISSNIEMMKITVVDNQPINDYYLNRTEKPLMMGFLRKRLLIGATFDDNSATAWFSNFGYHDVAISLNAIHEALLKSRIPEATLSVFNYPLKVNYREKEFQRDMQTYVDHVSMQLASGIGSSLGFASAIFVMLYIKERVVRAKLLQRAAGIHPIIMWGSAAVFDWAWFLIICMTIVISLTAFHVVGLSYPAEVGRVYFLLMVYGATMLPLNYLMSVMFRGPVMGFVTMFFVNIVFGQMGSIIVEALLSPKLDTEDVASILDYILQFFPLYDVIRSIMFLNKVGLTHWACLRKCEYLSTLLSVGNCSMEIMCEKNYTSCCVRDNAFFQWETPGVLRYITCSLVTCLVMWAILMLVEYKVYQKTFKKSTKEPPPLDESSMDADVVEEIRRAKQIGKADLVRHKLVAQELSKYYGDHLAVNRVSFAISQAEVFGLLGVNGAGKSTTFKMLMGDEAVSSGNAFVRGHSVKTSITSVYKKIGYCPQFDAVFGELTGRETLRLFSMLRGQTNKRACMDAELLAGMLGFTKHLDKPVDHYSGGNRRKLSTAIALLGSTELVFVDEPTAGVDPAAKRRVWSAILDARRAGRGVVLTSHSMVECEKLCSRLTIMVNGNFQCLGTPQHLKNKYSQGFTLTIKMRIADLSTESTEADERGVAAVKRYVESNFTTPHLMEEHQGLITYYLPDREVPWSRMFGIMERCREHHDVEDYVIAQTTLEQIFLQVTKYQKRRLIKPKTTMLQNLVF